MIRFEAVTKRYRADQPPALAGVDLAIAPGETVALLGRSGAGKSTLLRCINGLVLPESGTVTVDGQVLPRTGGPTLQAVRRKAAMIFQEFHLIDRLSVATNVVTGRLGRYPFWRGMLGLWRAADLYDARQMLERVGLGAHQRNLARELSGGQRQRVAIARAMMQQPRILLGDEPVASLDPVTARSVLSLIAELTREAGLTTVLSLHDVVLARAFCRRAVGIRAGQIVYDGPMAGVTDAVIRRIYGGEPAGTAAAAGDTVRDSLEVALEKGCGQNRH